MSDILIKANDKILRLKMAILT